VAIIKIDNFGGELPRVQPRSLPPGAAQVNSNLLATSMDFRPLQDDSAVATGVSGAKTLYRLARDAAGALRTGDSAGWITEVADKNHVKGQINDDATERTYVTDNSGTTPPRAIDALGANRLMGVPAPFFATAVLVAGESFVQEEATAWADGSLAPALYAAFFASLTPTTSQVTGRVLNGVPVAGAYSLHGMTQVTNAPWTAERVLALDTAIAAGLNDPTIDPVLTGTTLAIQAICLPFWSTVDHPTQLSATLRLIESPRDGSQLFSDSQITTLVTALQTEFDPESMATQRIAMDAEIQAFNAAIDFVLTTPIATAVPTAPIKPTTPEYAWGENDNSGNVRQPAWLDYDALLAQYQIDMRTANTAQGTTSNEVAGKISAIVSARATIHALANQIETTNTARRDGLLVWVQDLIAGRGVTKSDENPDGLVTVDPDRIIDARFYFATYVNDWGEESARSPITDMLEVDQYSSVLAGVAAFPSGRNLAGWRLYRANVGNTATNFQSVRDTNAAVAVLSGPYFDYFRMALPTYSDAQKGEELGEVCPTVTWAEPPYRMESGSVLLPKPPKGSDPYLRGLVGMPNGVMAGFIDNFVAFSDPYHPYAWPVEYQIPLQFEVVGLGVFGSSLFVGTYANPYIISGSDSASMSAVKLDDAQACLSAKSIAAATGGVLYASPDGVCFASLAGVEVITTALFAREDWQALEPASIRALMFEGVYYFWYNGNGGGCYALDTVAKKLTRVDMLAGAVFADNLTDGIFYTQGTQIRRAFSTGRRTGVWKSPLVVLPAQTPFAWLQVDADYDFGKTVQIKWYGDGVLRHTATLSSIRPVRLPTGRWLEHEVEVTSTARVTKVLLAGHTLELQAS
jgi:hypothetical protein